MFQVGDQVIYGIHGICRIAQIEERTVDRKKRQYFALEPREQAGARFLVPTDNEVALGKLKKILSREALDDLLHSPDVREDAWIPDENQRKQCYRDLIGSGDRVMLLRMVRTLHSHRQKQIAAGRKFHLCDENFLRDAQRLLDTEFSVVLGMEPRQVSEYVLSVLNEA